MKSGIYTITNKLNGHRYVGSAVNLKKRWSKHKSCLFGSSHHSIYLQRAWNKYGEDAFEFEVLEHWEPEFLISMEQWWMNMLRPEYNIAPVAGSSLGYKHTGAAKVKMAATQTGNTKATGNTNALGYKHTKEAKKRISAALKGNTHARGLKGRKQSESHRAKRVASQMGHEVSPETRAKISATLKRRHKCRRSI